MNSRDTSGGLAASAMSAVGCNTSFSYVGSIDDAQRASPCNDAYEELAREQRGTAELVALLIDRLGPVLRGEVPSLPKAAGEAGSPLPQSEIHSKFLEAAERARQINVRLDQLITRVTV